MIDRKFWKLKPIARLERNAGRRNDFAKQFQRLWINTTLAAFISALAWNIPLSFTDSGRSLSAADILDRLIRYGYLLWFTGYFFVAAVNNELAVDARKTKDVFFDMVQSGAALAAAFCLGFLRIDPHYGSAAYVAANVAICVIGAAALHAFPSDGHSVITLVRTIAVVSSFASFLVACVGERSAATLSILGVAQLFLWIALCLYFRVRVDQSWDASTSP